jgi:hypothetical protein
MVRNRIGLELLKERPLARFPNQGDEGFHHKEEHHRRQWIPLGVGLWHARFLGQGSH